MRRGYGGSQKLFYSCNSFLDLHVIGKRLLPAKANNSAVAAAKSLLSLWIRVLPALLKQQESPGWKSSHQRWTQNPEKRQLPGKNETKFRSPVLRKNQ